MYMLTREESKSFLPIIQAFAEGKTIQVNEGEDDWRDLDVLQFNYDVDRYRIKPESKYRAFKDSYELWVEMRKHQPFGWVIGKDGVYMQIDKISKGFFRVSGTTLAIDYMLNEGFELLKFADSTPFGILE